LWFALALAILTNTVIQVDADALKRKRRSLGPRKLGTRDRILLWLIRKRQSWSYVVLGVMFNVFDQSAQNYYRKIQTVFATKFLPRLFYLPPVAEIDPYIPPEFKASFPNVKIVGDGVHFPALTPEQFSTNNLTFCIYKWGTTWQIILRECKTSCTIAFSLVDCLFKLFSVITPDGRIVMRSLIYGGKAAEVQHMLNDSNIVSCLKGEYLAGSRIFLFSPEKP
jgi:hypothetical protein